MHDFKFWGLAISFVTPEVGTGFLLAKLKSEVLKLQSIVEPCGESWKDSEIFYDLTNFLKSSNQVVLLYTLSIRIDVDILKIQNV